MAIVNRTLDSSEQRKDIVMSYGAIATGVTSVIAIVPWPCVLEKAQFAAFGVSGSPTATIVVQRFITGTGFTAISLSGANALPAFGTSGVIAVGASLLATGSTLLQLQANDVLSLLSGGANSAVTNLGIGVVLRPIQDIRQHFALI